MIMVLLYFYLKDKHVKEHFLVYLQVHTYVLQEQQSLYSLK